MIRSGLLLIGAGLVAIGTFSVGRVHAGTFIDATTRAGSSHFYGLLGLHGTFRIASTQPNYDPKELIPREMLSLNWRYGFSVATGSEKVPELFSATEATVKPLRFGASLAWTDRKRWDIAGGISTSYVKLPRIKSNSGELWITYATRGELSPPVEKGTYIPMRYREGVVDDGASAPIHTPPPARHLVTGPDLLTGYESPESAWMPLNWSSQVLAFRYGFSASGRHNTLVEDTSKSASLSTGSLIENTEQYGHRLELISSDPLRRVLVIGATIYSYPVNIVDAEAALSSRRIFDTDLAVYRDVLANLPRWMLDASVTWRIKRGSALLLQGRGWQTRLDGTSGFGVLAEYRFPMGRGFWLGLHAIGTFGRTDLTHTGGGLTISFAR